MLLPKIKPSHPVIAVKEAICIGEVPGFSSIIKNPSPWLLDFLNLLDGSKTAEEIFNNLTLQGHVIDFEEITEIIKQLQEHAFLEDATVQPKILSKEELEHYDRQLLYFSLVDKKNENGFSYQEKLKKQHIAIFGMGGWGSWMALNLCSMGIGDLTLIDGDVVEASNLHRQILYDTSDIGKPKVMVAATKLKTMNPYVSIHPIQARVPPKEHIIDKIIENCSFIVLAWTNLSYFKMNTVEYIIHKLAYKHSIPVLEIGADPLFVSVGPLFFKNNAFPCFECVKESVIQEHYSLNPLIRSLQEIRIKNNRKNLNKVLNTYQNAPSLSIMSGLATEQIIKFITGCEGTILLGAQFKLNLQSYEMVKKVFKKNQECEKCKIG